MAKISKKYDHRKIERKWQSEWEKKEIYKARDNSKMKKFYSLVEFPYPSGDGLHTGHVRSYTAMDIISRKRRMEGYNVLYPIGWDAFGLPTENFAIKTGIHPIKVTKKNTDTFRKQLKSLGISFDWSKEVNTTDPQYYKWTQWIFLQMFNRGLAYKTKTNINWCLSCKIGLANEEVIDGVCERCGSLTERREKEQWMLAITKYADSLLDDLDDVDYLEKIKAQQRNWIGKSEGALIDFKICNTDYNITVFTTRADTLFGVTYIVIAPEHLFIDKLRPFILNQNEVDEYIAKTKDKTDVDRQEGKEKTGVKILGVVAVNPINGEKIPVYLADYVLANYGTGVVMAVPAHDRRDFAFATKHNLLMKNVVIPPIASRQNFTDDRKKEDHVYERDGILVNSGEFNELTSEEARKRITIRVGGREHSTFKLHDWVFSRQRYWGEPIPMIHCMLCGWQPVPEKDLPVVLPNVKNYKPTDNGESPLSMMRSWVNTICPKCHGKAKRETDVMPNWAGSSWYFLRYADSKNKKVIAGSKKLKYWMPVDWYNGGMEHTTLHLLYSRFWHKFLYDINVVSTKEPYKKRTSQGMVLSEGGVKMSKSKGNVINPDGVVQNYGADTLRVYEMFMGPFDQSIAWDEKGIGGSRRFIERVWGLSQRVANSDEKVKVSAEFERIIHRTIKKVSEDIEVMRFNTAISQMMICVNEMEKIERISYSHFALFLVLVAPFAPHVAEEIWYNLGNRKTIHKELWPKFNVKKLVNETITLAVQVNGKVRNTIQVPVDVSEEVAKEEAKKAVKRWIGATGLIKKIFYVPGRLVSIVV